MIRGAPAERMTAIRHVTAAGRWTAEAGPAGARVARTPAEYTYGGIGGTIGGCLKPDRIRTNGGGRADIAADLSGSGRAHLPGTHGPAIWIIACIIVIADL